MTIPSFCQMKHVLDSLSVFISIHVYNYFPLYVLHSLQVDLYSTCTYLILRIVTNKCPFGEKLPSGRLFQKWVSLLLIVHF